MKLVFICGSLEPGKDGVGDYTRRLATELIGLGHSCCLIAFNDSHLSGSDSMREESWMAGGSLVRFSSSMTWSEREHLLMEKTQEMAPDWVSIQFVPFAFHPKGLCWRWFRIQKELGRRYSLHVMYHEVWVAWNLPVKTTSRLLGVIQRALFKLSDPGKYSRCSTTTLDIYRMYLAGVGIFAQLHPLLGGIPLVKSNLETERCKFIAKHVACNGANIYLAGFFGAILTTFSPEAFSEWLTVCAQKNGEILILSMGRHNKASEENWRIIQSMAEGRARTLHLGACEPDIISQYLSILDEGLSGYPPELIGKSSAVASMHEHGLPVTALGGMQSGRDTHPVRIATSKCTQQGPTEIAGQFIAILSSEI